jgi:hypothetical protein
MSVNSTLLRWLLGWHTVPPTTLAMMTIISTTISMYSRSRLVQATTRLKTAAAKLTPPIAATRDRIVGAFGKVYVSHPDCVGARLWSLIRVTDKPRTAMPKSIWTPRKTELLRRLGLDCIVE